MTKIEWTDETWNPITGCTPIATGCRNCYAKRMANRLRGRCGYPKDEPFRVTLHPDKLDKPLHWKKSRMCFVCSMGDLFHDDVPFSYIDKILSTMALTPQHTYQVLTKRPERAVEYFEFMKKPESAMSGEANAEWLLSVLGWDKWKEKIDSVADYFRTLPEARPNLWLGASASNRVDLDRVVPPLKETPAALRFLSLEPLLGPVDLMWQKHKYPEGPPMCCNGHECGCMGKPTDPPMLYGINWVIVGGETGPGARPMHPDWVRSVRDQCKVAGVPFFFKGWGDWIHTSHPMQYAATSGRNMDRTMQGEFLRVGKKTAGRALDGRTWDEIPTRKETGVK